MAVNSEDSEESAPIHLTPEQQRQLELIESMPLLQESEISAEDWQSKSQEEKERILEIRRQAYEQRRKEFEEMRKMKVKRKLSATGEPKKRKKKNEKSGWRRFSATPCTGYF